MPFFRSAGASRLLESRPTASAALGVLFVVLCGLFLSGRLPRGYSPAGETYVMALSCAVVAAYFFRRAYLGWRR